MLSPGCREANKNHWHNRGGFHLDMPLSYFCARSGDFANTVDILIDKPDQLRAGSRSTRDVIDDPVRCRLMYMANTLKEHLDRSEGTWNREETMKRHDVDSWRFGKGSAGVLLFGVHSDLAGMMS